MLPAKDQFNNDEMFLRKKVRLICPIIFGNHFFALTNDYGND